MDPTLAVTKSTGAVLPDMVVGWLRIRKSMQLFIRAGSSRGERRIGMRLARHCSYVSEKQTKTKIIVFVRWAVIR